MHRILFVLFYISSINLILVSKSNLFAQNLRNKQNGIYKTYQEFLDNKPSITKPFKIAVDTSIDYENHDTAYGVPTYNFLDASKRIKKIWGLCDSGRVYVKMDGIGLAPISYIGKYSFIVFDEKNQMAFGIPFAAAAIPTAIGFTALMGLDNLLSPHKKVLIYFNKDGDAIKATDQAIGWLLRKDKDLAEAFNKEKKINIEVYEKYLILMNERYATVDK